MLAIIIVDRFN